jgi:hypothetical protein
VYSVLKNLKKHHVEKAVSKCQAAWGCINESGLQKVVSG